MGDLAAELVVATTTIEAQQNRHEQLLQLHQVSLREMFHESVPRFGPYIAGGIKSGASGRFCCPLPLVQQMSLDGLQEREDALCSMKSSSGDFGSSQPRTSQPCAPRMSLAT